MNNDINKKIDQIASILGYNNIPDNIKEKISSIALSMNNDTQSPPIPKNDVPNGVLPQTNNETFSGKDNNEIADMARKIMGAVNACGDSRMNLLTAMKPLLSESRQKKISDCIKILQLAKLSSVLENKADK